MFSQISVINTNFHHHHTYLIIHVLAIRLRCKTRIDVYETLCPQQMLVHKGGQINNVQLITGSGSAEMSHLQNYSVKIFRALQVFYKKINKVCVTGGGGGGVR